MRRYSLTTSFAKSKTHYFMTSFHQQKSPPIQSVSNNATATSCTGTELLLDMFGMKMDQNEKLSSSNNIVYRLKFFTNHVSIHHLY